MANLNYAKKDLQMADFKGKNLAFANMRGADLQEADLREANLKGEAQYKPK